MHQNDAFCVLQCGRRSALRSALLLRSHCVLRTLRSRCVQLHYHGVFSTGNCFLNCSGDLKRGCTLQNTAALWLEFRGCLLSLTLKHMERIFWCTTKGKQGRKGACSRAARRSYQQTRSTFAIFHHQSASCMPTALGSWVDRPAHIIVI